MVMAEPGDETEGGSDLGGMGGASYSEDQGRESRGDEDGGEENLRKEQEEKSTCEGRERSSGGKYN